MLKGSYLGHHGVQVIIISMLRMAWHPTEFEIEVTARKITGSVLPEQKSVPNIP
jgi:hypothetical protein